VYDDAVRWSIYQTVQYFIWSKTLSWCLAFCHS